MLNSAKTLKDYSLKSLDGEIGKVKDFYFDDHYWQVQYLVVDTGNWIVSSKVLIAINSIRSVDHEKECINIDLTKEQIENSPSLDSEKPVSKQYQKKLTTYYGLPAYWENLQPIGVGMYAIAGVAPLPLSDAKVEKLDASKAAAEVWDPNLRSLNHVSDYAIQSKDDKNSYIDDFMIDDTTWQIRYLVNDPHAWLPGNKFLLSTQWIESISWKQSTVFVSVTSDMIKDSPAYDGKMMIDRDFEIKLHAYYDKKGYWTMA